MNRTLKAMSLALAFTPLLAAAGELTFNGFLSAGGGIILEDDIEFLGLDDKPGFGSENVLGLQLDADLGEGLSATGQFVARGTEDYDAKLEWAYVAKSLPGGWHIRAGRLRAPFFIVSEYLEVGYAYPWIRPPAEFYNRLPISSFDGLDVTHNGNIGDWNTMVQFYYGSESGDELVFGAPASRELDNLAGIVFAVDYDWLTLRASYHRTELTYDVPQLNELLKGLGAAGFQPVADDLAVDGKLGEFVGVGFDVDRDSWFVRAEYSELLFKRSVFTDTTSWYATAGLRTGAFTWHLTYADSNTKPKSSFSNAIPQGVDPGLDFLKLNVDAVANTEDDYSSVAAGLRWDFMPNIALKTEYQQFDRDTVGDDFGVFSFAFDMTF